MKTSCWRSSVWGCIALPVLAILLSSGCGGRKEAFGHALVGSWRIDGSPDFLIVFAPENVYVVLDDGVLLYDGKWEADGEDVWMTVVGTDGDRGEERFRLDHERSDKGSIRVRGRVLSWKDPILRKVLAVPGKFSDPGAR